MGNEQIWETIESAVEQCSKDTHCVSELSRLNVRIGAMTSVIKALARTNDELRARIEELESERCAA